MRIVVCLPDQTLALRDNEGLQAACYRVSTSRNGPGERSGSFCTPRGAHVIRAKIGAGAPANTVFVRRRPTGEVWSRELAEGFPGRDWILTRILWLSGKRPGFNRLGEVDTMRRYVYLHGSPDSVPMGVPGSIGCVRMRNGDIIDLFDRVPTLTRVDIDDFRVRTGAWNESIEQAWPLREQVFVREQGVPIELEWDEHDERSRHALATATGGKVLGTARLLPDGHIGRMAVLPEVRGQGVGRALLDALTDAAANAGHATLRLNAQAHAAGFYRRFGFVPEGDGFMEAGIPHQAMIKHLRRAERRMPVAQSA